MPYDVAVDDMMKNQLMIHATNIHGLGARQVVKSLMLSLIKLYHRGDIHLYLSSANSLFAADELPSVAIHRLRRYLPNSLSRFCENMFSLRYFKPSPRSLILGDIPLRGFHDQVVLVHQLNLIHPTINRHSSTTMKYRIARCLFRSNLKYVKCIVVQTGAIKKDIIASYPELTDRVEVIPQPPPLWFDRRMVCSNIAMDKIVLFYPAGNYPHKNYVIFKKMDQFINEIGVPLEVILTLEPSELPAGLAGADWLNCVGRLSAADCLSHYQNVRGLFFPSLLESYGLPLVEAMIAGLPVVCSDLPYSRWLCEEQAIYFDPLSGRSACLAIKELYDRFNDQWRPDWTQALAKIPTDWDEVANDFINLLYA